MREVTFEFAEDALEALDFVKDRLKTTRAEVVSHGIGLMRIITVERLIGTRVILKRIDGSAEELGFDQLDELLRKIL